jgi:hypothetical protein
MTQVDVAFARAQPIGERASGEVRQTKMGDVFAAGDLRMRLL